MALSEANKLDYIPVAAENQFLPTFDWRTIGAVFALEKANDDSLVSAAKVLGRCSFTIREGYDPIDASSTGRVLEGSGDIGLTLRRGSTAFALTAGNLAYRTGLDDPLAAAQARVGEASVPSLKFTVAKEYSDDCYAALSWDLSQKKPELAVGWAGDTFAQQSAVVLHADPLLRTYKLSASVAFPGPEYRDNLLDEAQGVIEYPVDDGARHRLWATHTIKDRQWGYRTRVGGAFDLGRILNCVTNYLDDRIEPRIPPAIWYIPLVPQLWNLLVPGQDDDQVRVDMRNVDVEVTHEFGVAGAQLGLAKHFSNATVRGAWHTGAKEAAITYKRSGVSLTARLARQQGGAGGWGRPSLMMTVEPLGLL